MSTPEWSKAFRRQLEIEQGCRRAKAEALRLRCQHWFSELRQCSADAFPPHEHRYDHTEMPLNLADEERWSR